MEGSYLYAVSALESVDSGVRSIVWVIVHNPLLSDETPEQYAHRHILEKYPYAKIINITLSKPISYHVVEKMFNELRQSD